MSVIKSLVMAFASLGLIQAGSALAQPMRAVFVSSTPFTSGNYASTNSESSLRLYKKLGYNTVFEAILPPAPSNWNTASPSAWTITTTTRNDLVNQIRSEKARVNALGMDYCPFFAPWGWNDGSLEISERMREAVYRSVNIVGGYGNNVYGTLTKTTGAYDTPSNVYWTGTSDVTITVTNPDAYNAATLAMQGSSSTTNTELTTGQCYRFEAKVSIPYAYPLKKGDLFRVVFYQNFAVGQKPDPLVEPLGNFYKGSANSRCPMAMVQFRVMNAYPNGTFDIQDPDTKATVCTNCAMFQVSQYVWIEDKFPFGNGHTFDNSVFWEFFVQTSHESRSVPSMIKLSGFSVKRINPVDQLAYPNWEQNSAGSYPSEDAYMRTKAQYSKPGTPPSYQTVNYFGVTQPDYTWQLNRIDGHFLPTSEGLGWRYFRKSLDPLSPPYDLVSKEMLSVIKDGLDGQEPKYFHLNGDEAMVFRRDNASRFGGPNPAYNWVSNLGFYARITEKNLNRYKEVYGIPAGAPPVAKFVVWGDMFLPFGTGYAMYANMGLDASALEYWKNQSLEGLIRPNIWIYDEQAVLGASPPQFLLDNKSAVQNSIIPLTGNGFRYSATYSTWATQGDIQMTNAAIDTDEKHIQHEIDKAWKWWDIVRTSGNGLGFDGFLYAGWNGDLRTNSWNGLYPMAYFGWTNQTATDLPASWKNKAASNDYQGQPRLDLLNKNVWVPVDALPAIRVLLQ